MSALSYFLNAGFDTDQTTFALSCIKAISKEENNSNPGEIKFGYPKNLTRSRVEEVTDVLEIYYYNEKKLGLEITLPEGKSQSGKIELFSLDPDQVPDVEKDAYQTNRKKWKKSVIDLIKDPNFIYEYLRKPRDSNLSFRSWAILAADLSRFLQKKHNCGIYRLLNDRWLLRKAS
jgi:hypothetical protein